MRSEEDITAQCALLAEVNIKTQPPMQSDSILACVVLQWVLGQREQSPATFVQYRHLTGGQS